MRPLHQQSGPVVAMLAACAILAGCSAGAQSPVNPTVSSSSNVHHIGPLTTVSTIVGIKNDWISTISGSGSAMCWSISPGLPSVGPFGDLSGPVTLSYTPLCPTPSTLAITYGPGGSSTGAECTFNVSYNGTTFLYSVTQGSSTACSVGPSPTTRYDEILTYAQKGPAGKRILRPHIAQLGSAGAAQSAHRVRDAATSTSVTIDNTYSSAIIKESLSSECLTGSPPSDVPGNSSSSPFTVSFDPSCASDTGYFDMTYGPDAAAADACIFNVNDTAGTFSYSVTNNANTTCSYHLGIRPGTVVFVYAHT
jgi:hypothetical protein